MVEECQGCGDTISDSFYRVFFPDGASVEKCPNCPEGNINSFDPPHAG